MNPLKEALRLALDALKYHQEQTRPISKTAEAIEALTAALALPDAEPIGYMRPDELRKAASQPYLCRVHPAKDKHADMVPVYATPQPAIAPEPVELTDDERHDATAAAIIAFGFLCRDHREVLPENTMDVAQRLVSCGLLDEAEDKDELEVAAIMRVLERAIHAKQGGKP